MSETILTPECDSEQSPGAVPDSGRPPLDSLCMWQYLTGGGREGRRGRGGRERGGDGTGMMRHSTSGTFLRM